MISKERVSCVRIRYDRQIHGWGAENQQRIMKSNILFVNCDYLSCEVEAKLNGQTHEIGLKKCGVGRNECYSLCLYIYHLLYVG